MHDDVDRRNASLAALQKKHEGQATGQSSTAGPRAHVHYGAAGSRAHSPSRSWSRTREKDDPTAPSWFQEAWFDLAASSKMSSSASRVKDWACAYYVFSVAIVCMSSRAVGQVLVPLADTD